jgi:hypothetical protein
MCQNSHPFCIYVNFSIIFNALYVHRFNINPEFKFYLLVINFFPILELEKYMFKIFID